MKKNKEVGILTFHNADNLGAVLQATALCDTLNEIVGVDAEIIDYYCDKVEKTKAVSIKKRGIKNNIRNVMQSIYYFRKNSIFNKWRKDNMLISDKRYDSDNIQEANNIYDVFVTGSDQIWNYECTDKDKTYFLNFANDDKKKIAYAASLGTYTFKDNDKQELKELIERYNYVSVREKSVAEILKSFCDRKIDVLPDPVVLRTAEQWKEKMSPRRCKKKYVFVYTISEDVQVMQHAKEYADENGCMIISNKKSPQFIKYSSPSDFLSWIYFADMIFTNSFHGTMFSVIFNKKLGADIRFKNGRKNNRIYELLVCLGAENRIFDNEGFSYELDKVDSTEELIHMRNNAIEILRSMV